MTAKPDSTAPFTTSIIIPTWNSGAHIHRCLTHLQAQKEKDFEVILVDNGSKIINLAKSRLRTLTSIYGKSHHLKTGASRWPATSAREMQKANDWSSSTRTPFPNPAGW